jgi:ferredoxin
MPGLAHTLIFFGFLAVQPHSLELMIKGVCPAFEVGHWIPGLYGGYLFVADILASFVLVGFAYAIYRRTMLRPAYLTMGTDANLIILFTCLIIITFQTINAFQTLLPSSPALMTTGGVSRVQPPGGLFGLNRMSPQQVFVGYEMAYWIHMATILGFLIYIPGSKHLHLLAAAPNVFLKPLEREKAIVKTDIENEELETFGLGKVSELNWKNVLNLYACTECGRCEEQCPAAHTDKPLSRKRSSMTSRWTCWTSPTPSWPGNFDQVKPIVREDSPVTGDVLWSCTTCRACEDICPVNIEHLDFIIEARKHQVLMEASFPPRCRKPSPTWRTRPTPGDSVPTAGRTGARAWTCP